MIKFVMLLVVCSFLLSGCLFPLLIFAGRGDWDVEIYDGYSLLRTNGYCIRLGYKSEDSIGWEILTPKFYIEAFFVEGHHICMAGIVTQDTFATDEELESTVYHYYIVNGSNNNANGPLSIEEFAAQCRTLGINPKGRWIEAEQEDAEAFRASLGSLHAPPPPNQKNLLTIP